MIEVGEDGDVVLAVLGAVSPPTEALDAEQERHDSSDGHLGGRAGTHQTL
jgi:hypothetical protein